MNMIEIRGITKKFGDKVVLNNISFSVEKGQIFGLLGPNGAGKTTLIRILSTLLRPTNGTAIINNNDIIEKPANVRRDIGLLPENPNIYEKLNVYENLYYFASLYDIPKSKRDSKIKDILNLFDIEDRKKDLAGTLSKGLKQRLSLSITLLNDPKVLFLDEPTSGLDIISKKNIKDLILKSNEERAIILSSHNIDEIEKLCSVACIINKGIILKIDRPDNLVKGLNRHVIEITLSEINENVESSLKDTNYSIDDNKITFYDVKDPFDWVPKIVKRLVNANGKIIYINEKTGLEDLYIELIKDNEIK